MLKPQDVLVVLKLQSLPEGFVGYKPLSDSIGLSSAAAAFRSVRRAQEAGLLRDDVTVRAKPLWELLVHGLRFLAPPKFGGLTRGMPTSYAAPPLNKVILAGDDPPPVWPDATGEVRGIGLAPIYKTVPEAASRDPVLYEYLALADAIRIGRSREVELASNELSRRLLETA